MRRVEAMGQAAFRQEPPVEEEHVEAPPGLAESLVPTVGELFPVLLGRIPHGPAATLGRLGAPQAPTGIFGQGMGNPFPRHGESKALSHLRSLGDPVSERLLGALELTLDELTFDVPDVLVRLIPGEEANPRSFGIMTAGGAGGETLIAVGLLDQLRRGVSGTIVAVVAELAGREDLASLLKPGPEVAGEEELAAQHGAVHLALALAAAAVILRQVGAPLLGGKPAAVVGVALGAVSALLRESPMPPAYAAALLEKRRAEYLLPSSSSGSADVAGHRFTLSERPVTGDLDFSGNGLVVAAPGGVAVRTGLADGQVRVGVQILEGPPEGVDVDWWDEVVELGWRAERGDAVLGESSHQRPKTPPWPGEFRVRVHAIGRDGEEDERYELMLWEAPPAPEIVHKHSDRLGYEVRGEPVPEREIPPHVGYRWIRKSALADAATVTLVAGASPADVLRGFGADPAEPVSGRELAEELGIDPWVVVLRVEGGVLAVEFNGFQASYRPVLEPVSLAGRTASLYWNINGVTRLSFADKGSVLAHFELGHAGLIEEPLVNAALDGLDLDGYRDRLEMALVAVERFTGFRMRPEDIERMTQADVAYRILPHLPELYPEARNADGSRRFPGDGPLGADTDLLAFLSEGTLRDLAWYAASMAAEHAGVAGEPAVSATLAERRLTPDAEILARKAQLQAHAGQSWLWQTIHRASNPDPLAAAIGAVDAARYAVGTSAADLLDHLRRVAGS